jgi:hypothetical protein
MTSLSAWEVGRLFTPWECWLQSVDSLLKSSSSPQSQQPSADRVSLSDRACTCSSTSSAVLVCMLQPATVLSCVTTSGG